jgi:H+/Cl- antiporter ClcA
MKKSFGLLLIFLLIGLLTGSLVAHLLLSVEWLSFLTKSMLISWHPQADLDFLKYDFVLQLRISLLSILGLIAAAWVYRRM